MPRYKVPVDLELNVRADSPRHAYGTIQVWFNALSSGDFDKFIQMRQDGTMFPSSWQVDEEDMSDIMVDNIEAKQIHKQLNEQKAKWNTDEASDQFSNEEG